MTPDAAYLSSQWFAEQGFAVVIADGRGTPGRGPAWDRAVTGDLATPVLDDQVEALHVGRRRSARDLDLTKVGIRGWSFGGYLAALAVLRRPDVFHAGVAGAPPTDWRLYDTCYTERYLGHPDTDPENYERSSLLADAPNWPAAACSSTAWPTTTSSVAHTLRLVLGAAGRRPPAHRAAAVRGDPHGLAGGRRGEPAAAAGGLPAHRAGYTSQLAKPTDNPRAEDRHRAHADRRLFRRLKAGAPGITVLQDDQVMATIPAESPSWIARHPSCRCCTRWPRPMTAGARLGAGRRRAGRELGAGETGGAEPAHLAVDGSGRFLITANYTGGSISVHRLGPDGSIGERTDLVSMSAAATTRGRSRRTRT